MDTSMSHGEFEELAAGYVLGALEPDDEDAFQHHLESCAICSATVRDLEGVAADLAWAAGPVEPPPALRAAIRRKVGLSVRRRGVLALRPRVSSVVVNRVAVAAGVVALLAVSLWNLSLRDQAALDHERVAALQQVTQLLSDPRATRVTLEGTASTQGARVAVLAASAEDRGAMVAEGLPRLPANRVYELWALPQGDVAQAVGLGVAGGGRQVLLFSTPLQPKTTFAVTEEPGPRGSSHPTSAPILVGSPSTTA